MTLPPYHLFVSYNDDGAPIRRKLARESIGAMGSCEAGETGVWEASMMTLDARLLPPGQGEVVVHPVFMQSGYAAEALLPTRLKEAYARRGEAPRLELLPVWGAQPGLARETLPLLLGRLAPGGGVLVVAHGRKGGAPAPEPAGFADELRALLPGTEVRLAFFGGGASIDAALAAFEAGEVAVLPFLAGQGMHYRCDMPAPGRASAIGKRIVLLPPLGDMLA